MQNKQAFISIVLPVYNEEATLMHTIHTLLDYVRSRPERYELIFVDDGSSDRTPEFLKSAATDNPIIKVVRFSRNFGHQLAISAGIRYASGDAVVVMDADLQDPPNVIPAMIKQWQNGSAVVYGQHHQRSGESWFKRYSAAAFYRLLQTVTNVDLPVDTGDFRLMDRQVVDILAKMPETDPYVRGMVAWIGFKQSAVVYNRQPREAGESKYPLKKMLHLALNGITSFSTVPLTLANWLAGTSLAIGGTILLANTLQGTVTGITWLLVSLFVATSSLLLAIGLLGIYLGRIFNTSRGRPRYIVAGTEGFAKAQIALKSPITKMSEDRERMTTARTTKEVM